MLVPGLVRRVVREALEEDLGERDATSEAVVPEEQRAGGVLLAKQDLVVAGLDVAAAAFRLLDPHLLWQVACNEGEAVAAGRELARLSGRARPVLSAERVALNFLQRLSGIASLTRRFVEACAGTRAKVRDTRKTTPLLRFLEKYAVEVGGGVAHRAALDAALLVKDNHVKLAGGVAEATRRARAGASGLSLEVEVERLDQLEDAIANGADMVLLDNFSVEQVRQAVAMIAGRVPVEVSGGVRLDNLRAYAEAGPDFIAVGALTHSAPAVDISLELEPET